VISTVVPTKPRVAACSVECDMRLARLEQLRSLMFAHGRGRGRHRRDRDSTLKPVATKRDLIATDPASAGALRSLAQPGDLFALARLDASSEVPAEPGKKAAHIRCRPQ